MIPDLSVLWVISFVLLLTIVIQQFLFRPLLRVMRERHGAVASARDLAAEAERRAAAANADYESQVTAARNDVYRQMDATRREALDRRTELLSLTRQEAEEVRAEARLRIQSATEAARQVLSSEAESLSQVIVDRVLERKVS